MEPDQPSSESTASTPLSVIVQELILVTILLGFFVNSLSNKIDVPLIVDEVGISLTILIILMMNMKTWKTRIRFAVPIVLVAIAIALITYWMIGTKHLAMAKNSYPTPTATLITATSIFPSSTPYPPTVTVGPGTPSPTPSSGGGNPPSQGGISPTRPSKPPTPTPTLIPRPTATPGTGWPYTGTPFFADALTTDDGHWFITTNNSDYACKFVSGGGYQASSNDYSGVPCNFLNQQFTNVAFQADFSFVSGGPTRGAALTVDDDTDGSFYEFAIESNGNYLERIYHQTTRVEPDPISGYINYNSSQTNTLGVVLNNHVLEMYLNGTLIASHPDSSLSQGFISLESYSENGQQATVSFTNARIWEP